MSIPKEAYQVLESIVGADYISDDFIDTPFREDSNRHIVLEKHREMKDRLSLRFDSKPRCIHNVIINLSHRAKRIKLGGG
jgi:hypothetical protein